MPPLEPGLLLVLALVLAAEFVNGWNDAPNAIATVVSTRSLEPWQAILMASVMNLIGVLTGTAVAKTIGKGIVDPAAIDLLTVGGAMVGVVLWIGGTTLVGLPTSGTHALVAALAGAGLAEAGPGVLLWDGWRKVFLGLFFSSVLGLLAGFAVMIAVYRICRRAVPGRVRPVFRHLQILSSAAMAFSHGTNDGQKFMGIFALALVLGGALPEFRIPLWVMLLCAVVMAVGTATGGWKVIRTMGMEVTHLETHQGFAAETAAATTIEIASRLGIPISTTHTISMSIVGVGAARRVKAVDWRVLRKLATAWLVTFPLCGAVGYAAVRIGKVLL